MSQDLKAKEGAMERLLNVRRHQTGAKAAATQRKIEALYAEIVALGGAASVGARGGAVTNVLYTVWKIESTNDGRCGTCHRDAHRRGWQGHYYTPVAARASEITAPDAKPSAICAAETLNAHAAEGVRYEALPLGGSPFDA